MLQQLLGTLHVLETTNIKSLLTNTSCIHFVLYIMDASIKQAYETNFGNAYET